MTWFKVDDQLAFNMKVLSAGNAAMGLWVRAGSWSAAQLSDGVVPAPIVAALGGTPDDAAALVEVGLWDAVDDGWAFHDWDEYQPTKAQVIADRKATRDRVAKHRAARASNGSSNAGGNGVESGVSNGVTGSVTEGATSDVTAPVSTAVPSRPDPTRPSFSDEKEKTSSAVAVATPRRDVESLLDLLDSEVIANGGKAPARNGKNRDAMRLLLDKDGRSVEQVETAIRWCQADEFWRANILSASKLREKYDQLRLAAQRRSSGASRAEDRQRHNLSVVEQFAAAEGVQGIAS